MATPDKSIKYLKDKKAKFDLIEHKIVYTAYDKAATLKEKLAIIVKTLAVKIDKENALIILPGNRNLDFTAFKKTINQARKKAGLKAVSKIGFVNESWIKKSLKGIDLGAIPPFGAIWKLPVFIDKSVLKNKKVFINSGKYQFSIKISPAELKKAIPEAILGSFSKIKK